MAVRNDPMNQRGPQPGTNLARPKEPCPACGQTGQTPSTAVSVIDAAQFTEDQGAGLWTRACTAVGAHLRMLETYASSKIPGCSLPQLRTLQDSTNQITISAPTAIPIEIGVIGGSESCGTHRRLGPRIHPSGGAAIPTMTRLDEIAEIERELVRREESVVADWAGAASRTSGRRAAILAGCRDVTHDRV